MIKSQPKKYPFVDLTNDRNFKHFFSLNREVLLSILRAFLPLPDKTSIQDVEIISADKTTGQKAQNNKGLAQKPQEVGSVKQVDLMLKDPVLYPAFVGGKQSILDLNVLLSTGEKIDVEMQAVSKQAFLERTVCYWSRLHSMELNISDDYSQINPTYSLIFTTFPICALEYREVVNSFSIRSDKLPHFRLTNQLQMVFVDLAYFKQKDIHKLVDKQDQWCYFIKESGCMTRKQADLLSTKGEDMAKAVGFV